MTGSSPIKAGIYQHGSSGSSGSQFADFAPEIQDQMYRRLGGVGLLYAGTWLATFVYFRLIIDSGVDSGHFRIWDLLTPVCAAAGFMVWWFSRNRMIRPSWFLTAAGGFEIIGAIGIYLGMITWLDHGEMMLLGVGSALGIDRSELLTGLVQPLDEIGLRLLYAEGVNWVAVWLLVYPLIVPMPLRRTVIVTLLAASVVPATLAVSAALIGVPDILASWALPYALETTVPTFICAGIAIFGSRVVYRLTRDLSEARQMGNYRLEHQIGVGGMGEVWRARHQMLARPAAIKLIRPEVLGSDDATARMALKRFEREVQLSTKLVDPHTITIYDYGQTPDGVFFYVMELLDGIDLETFVHRFGPAPASRTIHWLQHACSSLAEAHARGLIHRDVKPANLYSCRYGLQTDFLKVLDFGLVKSENVHDPGSTRMTMEQSATGTPAYMPPELAVGEEADERSDVYALGCVAYWLLTGQTVFDAVNAMEMVIKHARETPVRPSQRTELEVPDDLEQVVMRCLQKDRSHRPAGAEGLAAELAACRDAGRWSREASDRWWSTHLPGPVVELVRPEVTTAAPTA